MRKVIIELILFATFCAMIYFLWPILAKKMEFARWEAEIKANNRRLFGDAGDAV